MLRAFPSRREPMHGCGHHRARTRFCSRPHSPNLHLANQGVTINQIHNVYEVPKGLQQKWDCRGYHGSPQHNSRGVIQRYIGFWDCNPATLIPLSPEASAPLYVEMMGGAEKIMARGRSSTTMASTCWRRRSSTSSSRPSRRTRSQRTCSPTSSSRSATSRRPRLAQQLPVRGL